MFLIFVFLPHFQILVMLWFKNSFDSYSFYLFLSQLPLHNVFFITENFQFLRSLLLLNHPSQFPQQITIIFLFQFLQSLNLIIQNLLVPLLKTSHLLSFPIKSSKCLFSVFYSSLTINFFSKSEGV